MNPEPWIPFWKTAPLFRLLLPLMAGIWLSESLQATAGWFFALLLLSLPLLVVGAVRRLRRHFWYGCLLSGWMLCLGACLPFLRNPAAKPNFIGTLYNDSALVRATLLTDAVPRARSQRAEAEIELFDTANGWRLAAGKAWIYLAADSAAENLHRAGDRLLFTKPMRRIAGSGNPGSREEGKIAARKGLYYRVFLGKGEWIDTTPAYAAGWRDAIAASRRKALQIIRNYVPDERSRGIAEALMAGYREDMDQSTREAYAATGVAHLVAISGLHVGMIYALLLLVLSPMKRLRYGPALHAALVIAGLWVFALFTGAGPSVMRSATMFSLLAAGALAGRSGNAYNSLAASVLFLLLVNPFLLWDIGFQLSHMAVLSILLFAGPIGRWVQTGSRLLNRIWQLAAVSIAVQVLTLPISVFYFHQLPVYFLPANLVAVPLTALWLYGLLLMLILSGWPVAASLLGSAISKGIAGMNGFIDRIHQLPLSTVGDIHLSTAQLWIWLAFAACLGAWWLLRSRTALTWSLGLGLLMVVVQGMSQRQAVRQRKLIVYNLPRQSGMDIIHGRQVWFWGDASLWQRSPAYDWQIKPSRILHRTRETRKLPVPDTGLQWLELQEWKILRLHAEPDPARLDEMQPHLLILSTSLRTTPYATLQKLGRPHVIADGRVPPRTRAQWRSAADSLHLRFHDVTVQGPFILHYGDPPPP